MNIYLLRHGTSSSSGTYCGITDAKLSERGKKQIEKIAPFLNEIPWDYVCSSPLSRCTKTFELTGIDHECVSEEELKEIDFGRWEGCTFEQIWKTDRKNVDLWIKNKELFTFPEGENITEFSRRVKKWFDLLVKNESENVLVISHSGVIRHAICHFLGFDINRADCFEIQEGCVSMISYQDDFPVFKFLNHSG